MNWFKKLWLNLKFWWMLRKTDKQVNELFTSTGTSETKGGLLGDQVFEDLKSKTQISEKEKDYKYAVGIANLKQAIKQQVIGTDYKSVLEKYSDKEKFHLGADLLSISRKETEEQKQVRELRTLMIARYNSDVRSPEEREKMIDERIQIMYNLQKDKEKRDLLRRLREARKSNNQHLIEHLEEEFYGKFAK